MANEVKLTIRVGDDGSLNVVANKAKEAAKATEQLGKSTDKTNKSRDNYSKGEKGVAGATSNSTKAFSKMRQSMTGSGGLVAAYATLAANAFALSAAFGVLQRAAAFEQLANGLKIIGAQSGKNLPGVANQLKEITGAAISTEEALRATAVATTSGFSTEQLTRLTKVAKGASQALGRNLPDALDRLVRGTAKLEPEILDELGIIVRLDEATRKYAASLQKPVSELTTFERQQAFLNATIEQGEKKYGSLADRLDTNVYDKLAASFSDLTKTIVGFVDYGIEPLIKFLSQNQFALFSAMLLFVSSISKTIIPSLQSVAAANKAMAQASIADSKKAGTVISKEYTGQLNKVIATATTMPKSFERILPAIKNNTVTVKELQKAVLNLKRSEQLRSAALKTAGANASAQKQQELAETTALRLETERLLALESKRSALTGSGARKKGVGTGAGLTARGLNEMSRATGVMQTFGIAARYTSLQVSNIGKTFSTTAATVGKGTAIINASRVAFTALAGSVRLFGAAILNAIPVIGQILFLLSLVGPYLVNLFGPSQSEKNIKEVTKTFQSFNDVAKELARSLAAARSEGEALFARYKAAGGVVGQLTAAFSALQDAQLEQAGEQINDNIDTIVEKTQKLGALREKLDKQKANRDAALAAGDNTAANRISRNIQLTSNAMNNLRTDIERLTSTNQNILDESQVVKDSDALKILQSSLARLRSSGLAEQLPEEEEFVKQLIAGLNGTGDATITAAEALEKLKAREKDLNETTAIFTGLPEKVNLFSQAVTKLADKSETEFTSITDSVKNLENELVALSGKKGGETLVQEFLGTDDGKLVKGFVANATKAFGDLEGVITKKVQGSLEKVVDETKTDYTAALTAAREKLEENNQKILESAANAQNLTNQAKQLSDAAQYNATITGIQVDLENQAKAAKIEGLQATRENLIATVGEEEAKNRISQIDAQIAALNADIKDSAQKIFREANARIKADQRLLNLARKQTQAAKELFEAKQKIKKSDLEVLRAGTGSATTAQDEAKILKDAQVRAKELEDEALTNKKQAINLEFDLLDAQLALERAKLDRLLKEEKITQTQYDEVSGALKKAETGSSTARTGLLASADEQTKANKTLIDNTVILAEAKATEEERLNILKAQTQQAERYASLGLDFLGNAGKAAIFASEQKRLEDDIAKLKTQAAKGDENSAALAAKELELQKLITDELIRQQGIRDKQAEKVENASASFAAALRNQGKVEAAGAAVKAAEASGDAEAIAAAKTEAMRQGAMYISEITSGIAEDFRKLGPEGELMAATMEAVSNITETFVGAFDIMADKSASTAQKIQAGLAVTGALLQGFASISKAASDARIRGLDAEIEAEKKRDGKSAESVAKIKALEAKKEKEQRKAFETEKKMKIAQAVIATAQGAISAYTGMVAAIPGPVGVALGATAAAMITAVGMKQISLIQSTSFQGGGSAAGTSEPQSIGLGQRQSSVDLARSQSARGELAYFRGESGTGGPENFRNAFAGYRNRAEGGNTAYMVGEQGPELFVPDRPGRIMPNDDIAPAAPTNVSFNINTIDASGVEDMLVAQRGNIIGMIRQAANSYGQDFVEDVDTSVFTQSAGGVSRY